MSDLQGNPRGDLYSWDGIHMKAHGYAIWTSVVKTVLRALRSTVGHDRDD
jgi:hypothetical protein